MMGVEVFEAPKVPMVDLITQDRKYIVSRLIEMMDLSALLESFVSLISSIGYEGLVCLGLAYLIYSEMSHTDLIRTTQEEGANQQKSQNTLDVTEQTSTDKIIVYFEGAPHDLTRFAKRHPGGRDALLEYNGRDVKEILEETGHSHNAYKILSKCKCKED